jgi:hypothetical protein
MGKEPLYPHKTGRQSTEPVKSIEGQFVISEQEGGYAYSSLKVNGMEFVNWLSVTFGEPLVEHNVAPDQVLQGKYRITVQRIS